jgi:Na+-translocating ferredoxin:NAD+ oxidoreductase RnfD subunit
MKALHRWEGDDRAGGLRRFAVAITLLNVLGHSWFGFEQAWAVPFVALGAAYTTELLLEIVDARVKRRQPRFSGGPGKLVHFLLSAHITGLAVGMLLYTNERLWPVVFAAVTAIGSKSLIRSAAGAAARHVMNPSNFGISATLILFPWVGIAPPYQFTENLAGVGDWLVPGIIVASGTFLNWRFTHRLPLIGAWLCGFFLQAALRATASGGTPLDGLLPLLAPMTGLAFVLYTFYMVTDPATTPEHPRRQVMFGAAVAATYGLLTSLHVVFGLFFALTIVSAGTGLCRYLSAKAPARQPGRVPALTHESTRVPVGLNRQPVHGEPILIPQTAVEPTRR